MRRGCLFGCVVILGLCVVGCGLGYFVGLPWVQDEIAGEFENAIASEVAQRLEADGGQAPAPGRYTFTEASLERTLRDEAEGDNIEDVLIEITPDGIELGFDAGGQEVSYSGGVAVEGGRLVLTDFEANNEGLEFLFPADKMGEAIEDGVNNYLARNGLRVADVELVDGEMTLDIAPRQG